MISKILALSLIACAGIAAAQPAAGNELIVSVEVNTDTIVQSTAAIITIRLNSPVARLVDLGPGRTNGLRVTVNGPRGDREVDFPKPEDFRAPDTVQLSGGVNFEQMVLLSPDTFQAPGAYSLKLSLKNVDSAAVTYDKSSRFSITVLPYSKEAQENQDNEYSRVIVQSHKFGERLVFAKALVSNCDDNIGSVAPELINKGLGVDSVIVSGLECTATVASVSDLKQFANSSNATTSSLAIAALQRLADHGPSADVRKAASLVVSIPPR